MIATFGAILAGTIRKEIVRSPITCAIEVIERAVRGVGTALYCYVDSGAAGISLRRIESVSLDFEFLYCIRWRGKTNATIDREVG